MGRVETDWWRLLTWSLGQDAHRMAKERVLVIFEPGANIPLEYYASIEGRTTTAQPR
jgi:hypothetical protein